MATSPATPNVTAGKFVSEPKATYSLSIENLTDIVAYSPNATQPDSLVCQVSSSGLIIHSHHNSYRGAQEEVVYGTSLTGQTCMPQARTTMAVTCFSPNP